LARAGRYLGPAALLVALGLSPALGYATTFVLLGLCALATIVSVAAPSTAFGGPPPPSSTGEDHGTAGAIVTEARSLRDPPPFTGEGDRRRRWRGRPQTPTLLFALAYALIAASALITARTPTDLLPLLGLTAPLFYAPLARLIGGADLTRYALPGAFVGLATALAYRYGLNMPRAAEGFWLTDPYRLAVTTLLAATLALGGWFTPSRLRLPSLLALAAAIIVIALTGSRTALLGLPVLLLITGLCLARRPLTRAAIVVATIAIVIAALFIELPGTERIRLWDVLAAIASGSRVSDPAIDIRLGLAHAATQLFAAAPIFGHGWSEAVMPNVLALLTPEQLSWGPIPHLHSDLGQFAVSGGLLGLAAYALLLLAPIAGYLQLPRETRTPQRLHALLVLVIGAIVLGLPDTFLAAPMTLTVYVVVAAAIIAKPARGPHPTQLR
jgi:O-antigen ligase